MPKLFVYNQSLVFEQLNLSGALLSRYDRLLRGDLSASLELRLQTLGTARDPNSGERWVHRHFGSRLERTSVASEADVFWMPIWPYGLCTAKREVPAKDIISHMGQFMLYLCPTMARVYEWLVRTPQWRRSRGADHVFTGLQFKDRMARWAPADYCDSPDLGRTPRAACAARKIGAAHTRLGFELLSNAVFTTTEDRLPAPERRYGSTSVVIPYYAGPKWRAEGLSLEAVVGRKRTLLAYYGNTKGFKCHLEGGACLPQPAQYNPNGVRRRILAAVRAANGTARDLHHQTPALMARWTEIEIFLGL